MYALRFIFRHLDRFRFRFWSLFVLGVVDGSAAFLVPVVLAEFTRGTFTLNQFPQLVLLLVGLYATSLILQWFIRNFGESLGLHFGNHLRLKYFRVLEKLPVKKLIEHHSGYILSLINRVGDGMMPIFFDILWNFSHATANVTLFFLFTARESIGMAVVNLIILIAFLIISFFLSKKMVPIAGQLNVKRAGLLEAYADFMSNLLTIKKLGVYGFAENRLGLKTAENYQAIHRLQRFHANRWLLLHSIYGLAFVMTIAFLLYQIARGETSLGVLILFVTAYIALRRNVERLSESFKNLMEMRAYLEKLESVVDLRQTETEQKGRHQWKEVVLKDVSFEYEGTKKRITVPSFRLRRGEKVGVLGRSGEGKTTFLHILANFFQPDSGRRLVDGQSYESVGQTSFFENMVTISQEVELFNLSIRDNVTLGQKVSATRLQEVLEGVDLWSWARTLPKGLETIVGEKGVRLSAGQKQRLNLARGVLLDRDIFLLDEPTSHLDAVTEEKVVRFLEKELKNKTAVIVAHQEKVRRVCQRSYVMREHVLSSEL